ncbi:MAG: hypothetical protein QOJ03_2409 [Frankiaceae bacterium]|jgi:anti-anti-sigma factor|nr:hypothetical protein [Frankiaceae bacterium]
MSNVRKVIMVNPPAEVDVFSAPGFADEISVAVEADPDVLVIDCAHVSFMDTAGIDVIRSAQSVMAGRGGRLRVRHAAPHLRILLDLAAEAEDNSTG